MKHLFKDVNFIILDNANRVTGYNYPVIFLGVTTTGSCLMYDTVKNMSYLDTMSNVAHLIRCNSNNIRTYDSFQYACEHVLYVVYDSVYSVYLTMRDNLL